MVNPFVQILSSRNTNVRRPHTTRLLATTWPAGLCTCTVTTMVHMASWTVHAVTRVCHLASWTVHTVTMLCHLATWTLHVHCHHNGAHGQLDCAHALSQWCATWPAGLSTCTVTTMVHMASWTVHELSQQCATWPAGLCTQSQWCASWLPGLCTFTVTTMVTWPAGLCTCTVTMVCHLASWTVHIHCNNDAAHATTG
jgi:hypothetical protein